ncbi:polyketide cyclase [Solimonas fluminis]|uniref:Polyketide cyclase n=1 Tax=Solimonas fluminis TaxID=2086571 RepID=A0A2S5TKR1_9GAMM|nr:SRPBCC family protein [Solimonas fluminis]PPE75561.1 polyketide cyclase [Solimonas fluminis]
MIKKILIVVAVAIAGLLVYAATQPDTFRVERTILVKAPPERIYPLIADFRQWTRWSPYEKLDPALKRTYSGAGSGMGAIYAWDGNKDIGAGRMEIDETTPPSRIRIKLDFFRPFEARNIAEFTMTPEGDATRLGWAMHGPANYLSKLMGTLFDMDQMIGKDFETGLGTLKSLAELPATPAENPQAPPAVSDASHT